MDSHLKVPSSLNQTKTPKQGRQKAHDAPDFQQVFKESLNKQQVRFSQHAKERIEQRKIDLDATDVQRISEALGKAKAKGVKSSLVVMKEVTLVASTTNHTIVTAVDDKNTKEHIFTNIDGAVFIT